MIYPTQVLTFMVLFYYNVGRMNTYMNNLKTLFTM